jgi:membrane protein DedA with SNARE-associated domain
LHFPTDLASFLDLIHEHGDAAYGLMFAYAASHSLLLALFAGYAAHSRALSVGTLIMVCWFGSFAGDVIRFWIGRRFGSLRPFLAAWRMWRMRQCANDAPDAIYRRASASISVHQRASVQVRHERAPMVHQTCTNDAFGTFASVTRNSLR